MTMDASPEEKKEGDLFVAPAPLPAPALAGKESDGDGMKMKGDVEHCASDMENGTSSTSATADTPNPTPTTAEHEEGDGGSPTLSAGSTVINTAATTTSKTTTATGTTAATTSSTARSGPGFFSRIGGGDIRLGDVYDMAQKRATQMKEQALTEVEKLRQHQQQQLQKQQENNKFVIPPSTGTLIIGDPVKNNTDVVITDAAGDDGAEKNEDLLVGKATSATSMPNATPKAGPKSSLSLSTISSPLRDAFNLAKQKSTDAANQLIFPIDTFIAPKDSDDDMHSGSSSSRSHDSSASEYSSDSGDHSSIGDSHDASNASAGRENSIDKSKHDDKATKTNNNIGGSNGKSGTETVAVATSTLTPTRIAEATNSVFTAAVGRYRRLKDSTASPLPPLPTKTKVVVGGADRVGGLRNFQLEDIINDQNASTAALNPTANRLLPPSLPLSSKPPPGQKNLALQTDGQWTMASNRGPNAIVTVQASAHNDEGVGTSATPTSSRATPTTNGDASTKPAGAGEAAEDGTSSANGMPPSGDTTPKPPQSKAPSRSSSYYEEAVRSVLKPGQRALFFGKGTMGVVLKPTYLASWRGKDGHDIVCPTASSKMGGVYIDSLIPGGHAELSGVVFVGDYVLKIGSVNVKNMTLEEVVNVIAEAKRPNIMVLTSEHDVKIVSESAEDGRHVEAESNESGSRSMTATEKKFFVSPLDLVFGFINKLEAEGEGSAGSSAPAGAPSDDYQVKKVISRSSLLDNDEEEESIANDVGADSDEEVLFNSPEKGNCTSIDSAAISTDAPAPTNEKNQSSSDTTLDGDQCGQPQLTSDQATLTNSRSPIDIDVFSSYSSHRTNTTNTNDAKLQHTRVLLLKREALFNSEFRSALGHSLVECISDPRRYSYLKHFFKNYRSPKEIELHERIETGKQVKGDDFNGDITSSTNQNKLLDLYLEMNKFHDALTVCSASGRDKLLMHARVISARFLTEDNGVNYQAQENFLPEHVAHIALGGVESSSRTVCTE
ncbi:hypothetical protein ACHAWU_010430 [Discostella pseudostelligera]|uniref:PDZ domain-containing protein n=1 Tax=Discostella pseudostelligera TaxID=259834 RepID=A0ABD3MVB6_9STRA